ncbi:MAG: DUF4214 domain-containing protein [Chloroflexi bacterium]|nr:MAG: DUF4214 domain-containing protein [Chloroflexota bacterium]
MGSRSRIRLAVSVLILVAGCAGIGISSAPVSVAAGGTTSLVLQQMDSCKQALGGSGYQLTGGGVDIRASAPSTSKQRVASSNTCPLQQGDCVSVSVGCMTLSGVPAPGTYRIHEIRTPDPDNSNPEGYAACNGGSACRSQVIDVTVDSSGAAQARVTNVYPDGTPATYPTAAQHGGRSAYAGTSSDPIVVHNFGLAAPSSDLSLQCDGDGDADDHLTGSPSAHCDYPENLEASACQPYPWSCTLGVESAGGATSTTTRTHTTKSTTSRSTTTVHNGPDGNATFIAHLYQDALGRPASTGDIAWWQGVLAGGGGRDAVGLGVIDSTEYHRRVVDGDYGLVGRAPDAAGRAFWTAMLDHGTDNEAVSVAVAPRTASSGRCTGTSWAAPPRTRRSRTGPRGSPMAPRAARSPAASRSPTRTTRTSWAAGTATTSAAPPIPGGSPSGPPTSTGAAATRPSRRASSARRSTSPGRCPEPQQRIPSSAAGPVDRDRLRYTVKPETPPFSACGAGALGSVDGFWMVTAPPPWVKESVILMFVIIDPLGSPISQAHDAPTSWAMRSKSRAMPRSVSTRTTRPLSWRV